MKKYYLALFSILFTTISCGQAITSVESLYLLALLDYRYKVTIGGTFFGNYNADVKTVALSSDGKCDRTQAGMGTSTTDNSGVFSVSYSRTSQSGGYVCVVSTPKADGTSRFFAVDRQQSFAWTGDAYNILVLPEPNTTSRSQFNVVSTMFNRMATQKLEKLAEGNKDLTKTATLLKSSNKQVVSQFGLSRGLSKSFSSKITLKDALDRVLYTEARASSVENSIPDLNDIAIDFSKKDDPVTLKFTVIIGGIQSLADPNDPSSYDKVVNIISNVVASGNKSSDIVFPGGAKLSAGGSFGALVSEKVQSFVQTQGASLGFSQAEINNIKLEAVALASAIDNPPIGNATVDKALYTSDTNSYKIGNTISISPQVTGASDFQITEVCSAGVCQAVTTISSSQWLQFSSTTGVFSGTVPADLPGDIAFQVKVKATKSGTSTTALVNFSFRGKPSLLYKGNYVTTSSNTTIPSQFSVGPLPPNTNFSATATLVGANSTLSITGLPAENCIQFSTTTGLLSGNFSCLTQDTTAQVTITNDMGSNTFPIKFIPNVKPKASSVSIAGTFIFLGTLTASYVYTDSTPEGVSLYSWYRCAANGTCTEITSAKAKTYTAQIEDVGQSLKFQVTPVDNLGLAGEAVTSTAVQIFNPSQNLVLHMPLDGTIAEKSDLNNPLTTSIVGSGVIPGTDRKGQPNGAYSFNGNGYIVVQNNPKIQLSNNLTISAWVKANQFKSLMGIVSKYISSASLGYILRFWNTQFDNTEMRSPNSSNLNTWYHVVATISTDNVKKLYVDGTFIVSGTTGIVVQANSDPVHIGNDFSDGIRYMNGSIDEVRIYNKELSASEVLGLYNYEK